MNWQGLAFRAVVLALWCTPLSAFAQSSSGDEVARNLFNAGKVAYDAGEYQDALQFFEQAYQRSHRSALLYNIGQAADRMRLDERAITAFRQYLEETPNASNRPEVENRIRALERSLASASQAGSSQGQSQADQSARPPTPEETARASEVSAPATTAPPAATESGESDGVTSQWWFWTAIGVVVVGGTVAAIALASGGDSHEPLVQGDVGGVHVTLEGR